MREKWLGDTEPQNLLDFVCGFRFQLRRACELANANLSVAEVKMKGWYDKKAEGRVFAPGDKVLVLLPIPGSSLQARFSGPYLVTKKVSDRDYLIATPDRGRRSRLCHINTLKPYHEREAQFGSGCVVLSLAVVNPVTPAMELSSTGIDKSVCACAVALSSAKSVQHDVASVALTSVNGEDDVVVPSIAVVQGRLQNSEMLAVLDSHLAHLPVVQRAAISELISSHKSLFSDVPPCTTILNHDIDVGGCSAIKQHANRVNPEKRHRFKREVEYMLEHGIAQASASSWSSPCLMVDKSDKKVPLTDRAKDISAFVTPDNFLQYTVMAFGMRNAPATFQRLVNIVLSGLSGCEAYLDDLVIYSDS